MVHDTREECGWVGLKTAGGVGAAAVGVWRSREGGSVDRDLKPSTDRGVRRQGPGGQVASPTGLVFSACGNTLGRPGAGLRLELAWLDRAETPR